MPYFGWSEDWLDDLGRPKVGQTFIKFFVYRYFELPEDCGSDYEPLVMIFIKCRFCGCIKEHYTTETEEDALNYIYDWQSGTYTSLCHIMCEECGIRWNHKLEMFWCENDATLEGIYRRLVVRFDSPLEEFFWENWKKKGRIVLMPQYRIGQYRVDFAHIPTKTVVELDGKQYHSRSYQIFNDKRRQAEIEQQGWRFIRFTGAQVFSDIDECIIDTLQFLSR